MAHLGLGLAYVADVEATEDLATARLESVLRVYIHSTVEMYLYFRRRRKRNRSCAPSSNPKRFLQSRDRFADRRLLHPKFVGDSCSSPSLSNSRQAAVDRKVYTRDVTALVRGEE